MKTCAADVDWRITHPYRCYFYPGRDCPGWETDEICGRIGDRIPVDAEGRPERGPW